MYGPTPRDNGGLGGREGRPAVCLVLMFQNGAKEGGLGETERASARTVSVLFQVFGKKEESEATHCHHHLRATLKGAQARQRARARKRRLCGSLLQPSAFRAVYSIIIGVVFLE